MKVSKKIKLSTYNCNVDIIITDAVIPEVNRIYKKHKIAEKFEDTVEGVVISPDMDYYYIILTPRYLTYNTIAHEVFHAVIKITEDRDVEDEEAQAWLCGHITTETYKFIEKKNFKVSHGR
jgi:hypothetical protein